MHDLIFLWNGPLKLTVKTTTLELPSLLQKMKFLFLILKMAIFCSRGGSKSEFRKILLSSSSLTPKTTHKPKMGMIYKELWTLLRKKWNFHFGYRKWPKMAPRGGSKSEFRKIPLSSSSLTPKQLTNQKWGWSMKNCDLYCEKTEIFIFKVQELLISTCSSKKNN